MYLSFYNLKEKPFTLSPDPKFFYYSNSHKEAMSQLTFSVTNNVGFVVLTGEVGIGKTTLVNTFINHLPPKYKVAYIYYKIFSTKGLLQNICKQYNIEYSRETATGLLMKFQQYLENIHENGKQAMLILDEAHTLSNHILEDIRILSNIEAYHKKYLNIFMLGQPELDKKLRRYDLRQLKDRITQEYHIKSLTLEETSDYVNHRLKVAGYSGSNLLTENAVSEIYDYSKGIPRKINIVADKALLMGYVTNKRHIDAEIVSRVRYDGALDKMAETVGKKDNKSSNNYLEEVNSRNSADQIKIDSDKSPEDPLYSTKAHLPSIELLKRVVTGTNEKQRVLMEKLLSLEEQIRDSKIIKLQNLSLSKVLLVLLLIFMMFFIAELLASLVFNYFRSF